MMVPETMSRGAQVALLQNSAWHRLKGPQIRGAKVERSKTLRGVLDPSTRAPQSFGPLNLCPAEFWRHSFRAPKNSKIIKKKKNLLFLRVFL